MLSKNQVKFIHSLQVKKNRMKEGVFVAEGPKAVSDISCLLQPRLVFATCEWVERNSPRFSVNVVTDDELRKISFLQHPQQVLAVFPMLLDGEDEGGVDCSSLSLALDGIQDPGNLGTIIRIADWFGIARIFCSLDTADVYNPKVVQATMGSIARVRVTYVDLRELLASLPSDFPVYGTFLDGDNIYEKSLTPNGMIVMGNEGKGISPALRPLISRRLLIPSFSRNESSAESLNVAVATAIACSEFRRVLAK